MSAVRACHRPPSAPLKAICRLGRPWHHALAVDDRRRPGERIAAQRAARRFGHESERDETDETREDHIIGRNELNPSPADQRGAARRCGEAEESGENGREWCEEKGGARGCMW